MRSRPGSPSAVKLSSRGRARSQGVVVLIGFMGAGKSSVGQALSRQLGWQFQDLDERITAGSGRTIERIFRESGEAGFRRIETAALRKLLSEGKNSPQIVALGGGAFVQVENARLLERAGVLTVFLDAPVEELWRRCQQQPLERPLRQDPQQFRQLYEERRPHYLKARWCIDTGGKSIETIATEVASQLGLTTKVNLKE
jgi:shikimate kinase